MKDTQTAFAKTLSAITAITLLVACARPCETTEITPARFVERTLAGEFVLVNTIPIYDASGDTITQEVLRTLSPEKFAVGTYEDCRGNLISAHVRPVTDGDKRLRATIDSLLAARPDLRAALSLAQGQPAPPPEPTDMPEPAERARIDALATDAEHRAYLEQLMADDQELRQGQEADIWAKHGYHSPQADSFTQGLMARDRHDFALAHYYVQRHGYPGRGRVGSEAASAPWIVFHHAHYPAFQRENFDSLAVAHRRGDVDADQMTLYLGRAYEQRFGERHADEEPVYRSLGDRHLEGAAGVGRE